jgi:hypothetical protein
VLSLGRGGGLELAAGVASNKTSKTDIRSSRDTLQFSVLSMERSLSNIVIEFGRSSPVQRHSSTVLTALCSCYIRGGFAGDSCPLFTIKTVSLSRVLIPLIASLATVRSAAILSIKTANTVFGDLPLHLLGSSTSEIKGWTCLVCLTHSFLRTPKSSSSRTCSLSRLCERRSSSSCSKRCRCKCSPSSPTS